MKTGLKWFMLTLAAAILSCGALSAAIVVPTKAGSNAATKGNVVVIAPATKPVVIAPVATPAIKAVVTVPVVTPVTTPAIKAVVTAPVVTPVTTPVTKSVITNPVTTPAPAASVAEGPSGFDFDEKGNCFAAGQAIVGFKAGTTELTARAILTKLGADPGRTKWCDGLLKNINKVIAPTQALRNAAAELARSALVVFPETKDVLLFCKNAMAQTQVEYAHPNYEMMLSVAATDPYVTMQWGIVAGKNAPNDPKNNNANLPVGKIGNFPEAWNLATGKGIRVAVIDTGCDLRHPDLRNKIHIDPAIPQVIPGYAPFPGGADNPPITYDNVTIPLRPWDDNGHGTHVAGIIGAQWNNNIGVAGAAPNCVIVPIKAFNVLGNSTINDIRLGVVQAIILNCRVINISGGGPGTIPFLAAWVGTLNSVISARSILVISMGNQAATPTPGLFNYQLPVALPGVVAVASHDYLGVRSQFSMTGPWACTAAPGGYHLAPTSPSQAMQYGILSTFPTYLPSSLTTQFGAAPGYDDLIGTSMAAPHVAGAAALLISREPNLSSGQIWAHFARFANRATVPAVTVTNAVTAYGTTPGGTVSPISPGYFGLFPPTVPPLKHPAAETLLINTPHNYRLGHGLLDPYRLLAKIESPARFPGNGTIPENVPTGHVRIFPYAPRHMFTATNSIVYPAAAYPPLNGMDQVDRPFVPAAGAGPYSFRAIMVGDKGQLLPGGTLQLRFVRGLRVPPLVSGISPFPAGVQSINLTDNGVGGDVLANDGIYTYVSGAPIPAATGYAAGSSILFQYIGNAPGWKQNTNVFIGIRIF